MSLSTCLHCGGHVPIGPESSNVCEDCGKGVFSSPIQFVKGVTVADYYALRAKLQAAEATVEAYRQRLSPAISCPIEEFLGPVKPCPFCGSEGINLYEDQVECGNCRATAEPGPWQFRDTREITRLQAEVARLRDLGSESFKRIAELEGDGYTGHFGDLIDIKNKRIRELEDELERHQKAADDSQQFFSERQKDAYLRGAEAALRWAVSQDGERYMEQVTSYIQRGLKAVCGETNNNQGEMK